jgi:hypothetical protein
MPLSKKPVNARKVSLHKGQNQSTYKVPNAYLREHINYEYHSWYGPIQGQLKILEYLKAHNVSVEEPISYDARGNEGELSGPMFFKDHGTSLSRKLNPLARYRFGRFSYSAFRPIIDLVFTRRSKKLNDHILKSVIEILSQTHNLGVAHNHPHFGNFVMDKEGKVTLIDFEKAFLNKTVFSQSAERIYYFFKRDYQSLYMALRNQLRLSKVETYDVFKKLISSYAIEDAKKEIILKRITNFVFE